MTKRKVCNHFGCFNLANREGLCSPHALTSVNPLSCPYLSVCASADAGKPTLPVAATRSTSAGTGGPRTPCTGVKPAERYIDRVSSMPSELAGLLLVVWIGSVCWALVKEYLDEHPLW
jgi:hypothetical protein